MTDPAPTRLEAPPTGPRADIPFDGHGAPPAGTPSGGSSPTLPFDSVSSAAEWWYRPVVDTRTWVALAWLGVGSVWGTIVFAAIVVLASLTFSLSFIGVGLLLVVPTFTAIDGLAGVERRRAAWLDRPIPPPTLASDVPGTWATMRVRMSDGARWRQVLFFSLFAVAGPILFSVGLLPWALVARFTAVPLLDFRSLDLGALVLSLLLLGAAPRITVGVALAGRAFVAALLGPNETRELQERVDELSGQRQQILDAVADERRRIERNLHDGVQQHLVALGIDIGRARTRLDHDPDGARQLLDDASDKVRGAIGELRMIGRGLHPAVLEDRGLDAALSAVVANASIPITVRIETEASLPQDVAATAYYVASEATANVLKHARARVASITLANDPRMVGAVRLTVHDDGRGGVDATTGTGLAGMRARVEGMDGTFTVDSPTGGPTTVTAVLPLSGGRR